MTALPPAAIWFLLLLVGSLVLIDDFDFDRPATYLYFGAVVATVVGVSVVCAVWERRYRASQPTGADVAPAL